MKLYTEIIWYYSTDFLPSVNQIYRQIAPLEQGDIGPLPWDRTCLGKWVAPLEQLGRHVCVSTDRLLRWSKEALDPLP